VTRSWKLVDEGTQALLRGSSAVDLDANTMKAIIADKRTNCGLPADANVWHQPHTRYLLNIG
jgi:hypothetical protein